MEKLLPSSSINEATIVTYRCARFAPSMDLDTPSVPHTGVCAAKG
jgi:hypothetical protein